MVLTLASSADGESITDPPVNSTNKLNRDEVSPLVTGVSNAMACGVKSIKEGHIVMQNAIQRGNVKRVHTIIHLAVGLADSSPLALKSDHRPCRQVIIFRFSILEVVRNIHFSPFYS